MIVRIEIPGWIKRTSDEGEDDIVDMAIS